MSFEVIEGNIFSTNCQVIVNTINCVGVMGAGIALECRLRYPEMYNKYIDLCANNKIDIGVLWLYKSPEKWVLNFPTKKDWKFPSKIEYLHSGLEKFVSTYKEKGIESIAFPMLGADKGGLSQDASLSAMRRYLEHLDIKIEVYRYLPTAHDDLYLMTKDWLLSQSVDDISTATKITKPRIEKLLLAMRSDYIFQLNQLGSIDGVGIKTLEKIFDFAKGRTKGAAGGEQQALF